MESLELDILPYSVLLIVPGDKNSILYLPNIVMAAMSDQVLEIRQTITYCFANLIKMIPLEVNP